MQVADFFRLTRAVHRDGAAMGVPDVPGVESERAQRFPPDHSDAGRTDSRRPFRNRRRCDRDQGTADGRRRSEGVESRRADRCAVVPAVASSFGYGRNGPLRRGRDPDHARLGDCWQRASAYNGSAPRGQWPQPSPLKGGRCRHLPSRPEPAGSWCFSSGEHVATSRRCRRALEARSARRQCHSQEAEVTSVKMVEIGRWPGVMIRRLQLRC